jgi:hypothetical protein
VKPYSRFSKEKEEEDPDKLEIKTLNGEKEENDPKGSISALI